MTFYMTKVNFRWSNIIHIYRIQINIAFKTLCIVDSQSDIHLVTNAQFQLNNLFFSILNVNLNLTYLHYPIATLKLEHQICLIVISFQSSPFHQFQGKINIPCWKHGRVSDMLEWQYMCFQIVGYFENMGTKFPYFDLRVI